MSEIQSSKGRVLLAEDDVNLGKLLKEYLVLKGYETQLALNGREGFDLFRKNKFDLCLLDVMMPIKDGFTLAREIRASDIKIPIVFLTAKSMNADRLEGFKAGADDYITKPFSMEELLARMEAILRRTNQQVKNDQNKMEFIIGRYVFNSQLQQLNFPGEIKKLTTRESELLRLLCLNFNQVLDRNFALNSIWKDDNYFNGRSMDVYIARLRRMLKKDERLEIINVHGRGFKLMLKEKS